MKTYGEYMVQVSAEFLQIPLPPNPKGRERKDLLEHIEKNKTDSFAHRSAEELLSSIEKLAHSVQRVHEIPQELGLDKRFGFVVLYKGNDGMVSDCLTLKLMESIMKTGKLFNRSYIIRVRKNKTRYGLSSGECFYNIQFHKFGLYLEKNKPSKEIGFKNIKDLYQSKKVLSHVEVVNG